MRYTLRQLEVFLAIARFENVTKAANNLAMSQSAASGALRDLEQQFDVLLFDRVGKRLQTNEVGQLLRPKAEALLQQAIALEQSLSQQNTMGKLKIGATLTIGNYLAVELMAEYIRASQGGEVSLEVGNTASIAKQVLNFDLDIGLVEGELQHSSLQVDLWKEDELVVFCSPNHPFAMKQELTDDDLIKAQWILREQGSGTRQGFDRAMQGLLSQQTIKLELQHTEAIKGAVEAGLGVSCLSRIALDQDFTRGNLIPLSVPQRDLNRGFYIIMHKDKYQSAGINCWLHICQQVGISK